MELDKSIYLADRNEWHKWLEENHDTAGEAWLIHYKKKSGKTGIGQKEAVEEAICFGWIDGKLRSIDDDKYILRYSPRRRSSVWSKINRDKAEELIEAGRMQEAGFLKIEEAKKNGNWDNAYTSRQPEEMPDDLKEALEKDKVARDNFYGFANSYRNNYIGWLNSARMEATRKKRIAEIIRRARENVKPGML